MAASPASVPSSGTLQIKGWDLLVVLGLNGGVCWDILQPLGPRQVVLRA